MALPIQCPPAAFSDAEMDMHLSGLRDDLSRDRRFATERSILRGLMLPNFPPARTIGRQQFIRTSDLLNWMMAE